MALTRIVETEIEKSAVQLALPEWREMSEHEQAVLCALLFSNRALKFAEVYSAIVHYRLRIVLGQSYTKEKSRSDFIKYGGLRGLLDHYREKGISLPGYPTIEDVLSELEAFGWINKRKLGGEKYYSIPNHVADKVRAGLPKSINPP